MLKGFKEETKPLNEYESNVLLPVIIQGLSTKVGKKKAVTNGYICKTLQGKGYKLSEARVRKLINHIRTSCLVIGLIATSDGYYIAESKDEIKDYVDSLKGREDAIRSVRISMEKQMSVMYG
ncbi:MAG: hypothetical protein AB2L20_11710 [Mangrovibacterium sp.]